MSRVNRNDKLDFPKAIRLDNGYLSCVGTLTRTGVFKYGTGKDASYELRLDSEVFAPEAVKSFSLVPLTEDHPTENGGEVTAKNTKHLAVGFVGTPEKKGSFLVSEIRVTDEKAIAKIESGQKVQLSCGYTCDREVAPKNSVWRDAYGNNYKYTHIQRNIRGNHVALVERGRAGPDARIHMDAEESVEVSPLTEVLKLRKIKIDSEEFDVVEEIFLEINKWKKDATAATARADMAEAKLTELQAQFSPEKMSEKIKSRVSLETKAQKMMRTDSVDFSTMTDAQIQKMAIKKVTPSVVLDGKSDEVVAAIFELCEAVKPQEVAEVKTVKADAVGGADFELIELRKKHAIRHGWGV